VPRRTSIACRLSDGQRAEQHRTLTHSGLGSVTEVVDSSEATQNSYRYEAWGQVQSSTENVTNPYRYIGAYGVHWDSSPALYFMQARYYMASVGRFITLDPLRGIPTDPITLHRYLYTHNNPANVVDPSGLQWWKDWRIWGAGGLVTGAASSFIEWVGRRCVSILEKSREELKIEARPCWEKARTEGAEACNDCCGQRFAGTLKVFDCKKGCEKFSP